METESKEEGKNLITLEDFNSRIDKYYSENISDERPNGIACPICNMELFDSNPTKILLSLPPQVEVHCQACGCRGYRYQ